MALETCPKCNARFPARDALYQNQAVVLLTGLGGLDTRVRCPGCGHVFEATEIRFLGFLSPHALKVFAAIFVIVLVLGAAWALLGEYR